MAWGTVELEPEVVEWLEGLSDDEFGQAERYVDLLGDEGVHLGEPFSRQLRGKLRELRFYLGRRQIRIPVLHRFWQAHRFADRLRKDSPTRAPRGQQSAAGDATVHRRGAHSRGGLMVERTSWDRIKSSRADSPQRRRGYEKAGRAIRLAFEIRALREARGVSQRELAERVGTTQSAIARLEAGNVSPSLPTLDRIAEALDAELTVTFTDSQHVPAGG